MTAPTATGAGQRIDKWLWHARIVKTRTLAQRLAESGHVRLNGRRVEAASRPVKIGDVLTIALEERVLVLSVCGFAPRRVGAPQVGSLYIDESPLPPPRPVRPPPALVRDKGAGRPTKRERRKIDHLKGRD